MKVNKTIELMTPQDVREFARGDSMLNYVISDVDIYRALQSLKYVTKVTENRVYNAFLPYHFWVQLKIVKLLMVENVIVQHTI